MRLQKVFAEPKFYRESDGNYLMAYAEWPGDDIDRKIEVRCAALNGNPLSLYSQEVDPSYLKNRARRVDSQDVPQEWMREFQTFLS